MWLPTLVAVGLHVGAGAWWLAHSSGTAAGSTTMLAEPITLVWLEPRHSADTPAAPPSPEPPITGNPSPAQPAAPVPEEASARTPAMSPRDNAVAPRAPAPTATGPKMTDIVSGAVEPLEPAYLAGEPLIKLGNDEAWMNGSIALHLSIDDTGRVVDSRLSSQQGLPESAVATLVRAFTGYVYVPARRGGRPVRSDVTMVISIRDGQGVSTQSP